MELNPLKKHRALRGLTVRELAQKAKMNPKTISFIENDHQKATIVSLGKLATALEIDIEILLPLLDTSVVERGRKGGTAAQAKKGLAAMALS